MIADVLDCDLEDKGEVLVMIALANYCGEDGTAFPSVARIPRLARMTSRHVQRTLRSLERRGYVERVPGTGRGNTNVYRVIPHPVRPGDRADFGGDGPPPPEPEKGRPGCHPRNDVTHSKDDTTSPFRRRKGDIRNGKGDILDGKGDTGVTRTVRIEPSESEPTERARGKLEFDPDLGIRPEVAQGFIEHRRAIKAPLTPRAMTLLSAHLRKIKATRRDPNAALDLAVARGWRGIELDWIVSEERRARGQPPGRGERPGVESADDYAAKFMANVRGQA